MAVVQNFVSVFFRKLLSFLGVSNETLKLFRDIYWQYKLYGISSLTKDPLKGLKVLRKRVRKRNKKFISYRCINIGDFTDLSKTEVYTNNYDTKLIVGKYCSVSWDVSFLLGIEHTPEFNTMYSFNRCVQAYKYIKDEKTKGDIVIGNDVWIASNVKILSGVNIGNGAVIGANSLVTRDVEKYTIAGGIPAREIRKRFSDETIKTLEEIKWCDWDIEDISKIVPILQSRDIEALKKYYDKNIVKQKNGT
jgi:acetyltransferase-like isoleucine patch superfamily enzyme